MLGAFAALLLFQLVGELTVRTLGLPFPGPVVGLVLLFVALMIRGSVPEPLRAVSTTLLQHLMLLLVPATAAVILHGQRLRDEWWPLLAAGIGGAVVTMAVTALTLRLLLARRTVRAR